MIKLNNVWKIYPPSESPVLAMQDVSIAFRESEFVSILGPSGCGKTTLLNIVGSLDTPTKGTLTIDGRESTNYKDSDWDSYRNHHVGFVFQNYNLIMHQTVLSNVELALRLSGVSAEERKAKATAALERVGLGDKLDKMPNLLSGGQMQRVAIARAIVNDPSVILADEPTGALDSHTAVEVMDLLADLAKDHLVIMVTHNPELAEQYSTRIINMFDGRIVADSNPMLPEEMTTEQLPPPPKSKLGFLTAFQLSLQNLLNKKGRTILTAFAGSIGITFIALVLALSNGVNNYFSKMEADSSASFPITISQTSYDSSALLTSAADDNSKTAVPDGKFAGDNAMAKKIKDQQQAYSKNDIMSFSAYLQDHKSELSGDIVGVDYLYEIAPIVYRDQNGAEVKVSPEEVKLSSSNTTDSSLFASASNASNQKLDFSWIQMPSLTEVRDLKYSLVGGNWPTNADEAILLLDENGRIDDFALYQLGLMSPEQIQAYEDAIKNETTVDTTKVEYSYDDAIGKQYMAIAPAYLYRMQGGLWSDGASDSAFVGSQIQQYGIPVKIVGVAKAKKDEGSGMSGAAGSTGVGYTEALTKKLVDETSNTDIAKQLSGSDTPEAKYTLAQIGYEYGTEPYSVSIYPSSGAGKQKVVDFIAAYNNQVKQDSQKVKYVDAMGELMKPIRTMVDIAKTVLIAFTAISLVVAAIMIAIITYISVLERTKEIGILRALGASKSGVSKIFTAETFIEGLFSGVFGILVALIICLIAGVFIQDNMQLVLTFGDAILLIVISVLITLLAGLIPSASASKKDPVTALRSGE